MYDSARIGDGENESLQRRDKEAWIAGGRVRGDKVKVEWADRRNREKEGAARGWVDGGLNTWVQRKWRGINCHLPF